MARQGKGSRYDRLMESLNVIGYRNVVLGQGCSAGHNPSVFLRLVVPPSTLRSPGKSAVWPITAANRGNSSSTDSPEPFSFW